MMDLMERLQEKMVNSEGDGETNKHLSFIAAAVFDKWKKFRQAKYQLVLQNDTFSYAFTQKKL